MIYITLYTFGHLKRQLLKIYRFKNKLYLIKNLKILYNNSKSLLFILFLSY